ncbi:MAG: hypothetical protein PHU85_05160 [Phycisphaerae bacterium]|nr:hypothetical protein [Phycisphaerae bacterium]
MGRLLDSHLDRSSNVPAKYHVATKLAAVLSVCAALGWASQARAGAHSDWGCGLCHLPHKAAKPTDASASWGVPLWNPVNTQDGLPTFNVYTSPAFNALGTGISQPDGPSKMCLGCHDGTFWVSTIHTFGNTKAMTLTESHPISFVFDTALSTNPNLHVAGSLKDPATALSGLTSGGTIATDLLDSHGKVQCTTCHDVHTSGQGDYHLRYDYSADAGKTMCRTCHNK